MCQWCIPYKLPVVKLMKQQWKLSLWQILWIRSTKLGMHYVLQMTVLVFQSNLLVYLIVNKWWWQYKWKVWGLECTFIYSFFTCTDKLFFHLKMFLFVCLFSVTRSQGYLMDLKSIHLKRSLECWYLKKMHLMPR